MIKALLLTCLVAAGPALGVLAPIGVGHYGAPWGGWNPYNPYSYSSYPDQPALASQSQNIIRSPFNLGHIATYSKAIDTPFSSVRKADIRVSNPGLAVAPVGAVGINPYVSHLGVPVAAPVAKVGVAYSAAPAVSYMTYNDAHGLAYSW